MEQVTYKSIRDYSQLPQCAPSDTVLVKCQKPDFVLLYKDKQECLIKGEFSEPANNHSADCKLAHSKQRTNHDRTDSVNFEEKHSVPQKHQWENQAVKHYHLRYCSCIFHEQTDIQCKTYPITQHNEKTCFQCDMEIYGRNNASMLKWDLQKRHLVFLASILIWLSVLCNSISLVSTANRNYTVGIFMPLCSSQTESYMFTAQKAINSANVALSKLQYQMIGEVYDSCLDSLVENTVKVMTNARYHAIIGPASHPLCTSTAYLSNFWHKPMITWSCLTDILTQKDIFPNVARTVASTASTAQALAAVLKHFKWKRIALFYTPGFHWYTVSRDIQHALLSEEFIITHFVELQTTLNATHAAEQLQALPKETKGKIAISYLSYNLNMKKGTIQI